MARIRTIKPEFWQDEKLAPLSPIARLVFLGLISMADDAGRVVDNVKSIDGFVFPHTNDTSREALDTLARLSRIQRYQAQSGQRLIQILNWTRHQKVDKPSKHLLPPPPDPNSDVTTSSSPAEESSRDALDPVEGSPRSDLGPRTVDLGPSTLEQRPPIGDRGSHGEVPASLFKTLPGKARELLTRFYEFPVMNDKQRERYRNVAMQLVDAIDPKHPGPKIRGGQRVKARSVEHLDDVCAAVMRDPPNDRDYAVVFVLKKLLDPEKGPSVTQLASEQAAAERNEEERYHRAAKAAGIEWAKDHPEQYEPILREVETRYKGKTSSFATVAKESELVTRCAKAADFPSFDDWVESQTHARTPVTAGSGQPRVSA
jgi:hypothetical protein